MSRQDYIIISFLGEIPVRKKEEGAQRGRESCWTMIQVGQPIKEREKKENLDRQNLRL